MPVTDVVIGGLRIVWSGLAGLIRAAGGGAAWPFLVTGPVAAAAADSRAAEEVPGVGSSSIAACWESDENQELS